MGCGFKYKTDQVKEYLYPYIANEYSELKFIYIDRVSPAQIAEFSALLSTAADVQFHQAEISGHAGLHDNAQSAAQRKLLWDFLAV